MSLQEAASNLLEEQIKSWPLLGENWSRLDGVKLRTFDFDGCSIKVQFNPKRITSSAAKVDKKSIEHRPCFLCGENRPAEQQAVLFGQDYEILCNPFPIFPRHYTISRRDHTPQVIDSEFGRMLELSGELPELVIFYNAPNCGASAPDHMHFQAGNRGFLPLEAELAGIKTRFGQILRDDEACSVHALDDGLRRFFVLESSSAEHLESEFRKISAYMRDLAGGGEPMLNILCYFREEWQVLVFPREVHRPWQFFEEGDSNILISPASVDMGGTMITPLEKDFNKITRDDVLDIYRQIGLSGEHFLNISDLLKKQEVL